MSTKYYAIMGIYKKSGLPRDAINGEIAKAWAACDNVEVDVGLRPGRPGLVHAPSPDYRIGVDRPAGWKSPTADPKLLQEVLTGMGDPAEAGMHARPRPGPGLA